MTISQATPRPWPRCIALGLIAWLGSLAMGCGPDFERLDFEMRTVAPNGVNVTINHKSITIPVGIAVGVIVTPIDDNGDRMGDDDDDQVEVLLHSNDPGVIGIDPALERRSFVIYGAGPGSAGILVDVDGEYHGKIPATVVLQ